MLWQERWRLAGLLPMALAVPVALSAVMPSVLVSDDGSAAAVRGADGRYHILGKADEFVISNWLRADADPREPDDPSLNDGVRCDPLGCTATLAGGGIVALSQSVSGLPDDCLRASLVVSRSVAAASCGDKATVIDRRVTGISGSIALYRRSGEAGFDMVTAYPPTRRPFMPPARDQ
jgi:competence protein ComEC